MRADTCQGFPRSSDLRQVFCCQLRASYGPEREQVKQGMRELEGDPYGSQPSPFWGDREELHTTWGWPSSSHLQDQGTSESVVVSGCPWSGTHCPGQWKIKQHHKQVQEMAVSWPVTGLWEGEAGEMGECEIEVRTVGHSQGTHVSGLSERGSHLRNGKRETTQKNSPVWLTQHPHLFCH